ncbi:hypothetical protein ACTXT7_005200 [Hymenolepis weldensis]
MKYLKLIQNPQLCYAILRRGNEENANDYIKDHGYDLPLRDVLSGKMTREQVQLWRMKLANLSREKMYGCSDRKNT